MKKTAIVLSGGKGTRLGANIPKQYIEVCKKPVLAYTLMAFEKSSVDDIIIVAANEYVDLCREIAKDCECTKLKAVTTGGKERYDSVLNGIRCSVRKTVCCEDKIEGFQVDAAQNPEENCFNGDIVLIHDGARPFISPEIIDELIKETQKNGAAIAATPCTDTIKLIDEKGNIRGTTDRKLTWAAQTPQVFFADKILEAYEKVIGSGSEEYKGITITDDAMVYQLAFPEKSVKVVDAGRDNIKITTASDLELAENIVIKTMI